MDYQDQIFKVENTMEIQCFIAFSTNYFKVNGCKTTDNFLPFYFEKLVKKGFCII